MICPLFVASDPSARRALASQSVGWEAQHEGGVKRALLIAAAVKRVLGDDLHGASMSSTKSAIGHLLGGAGAVEAIFCILAIRDQIVPPTLNLDDPDEGTEGVDLVPHKAKKRPVRAVLSNSFGFGGTNASLIMCLGHKQGAVRQRKSVQRSGRSALRGRRANCKARRGLIKLQFLQDVLDRRCRPSHGIPCRLRADLDQSRHSVAV